MLLREDAPAAAQIDAIWGEFWDEQPLGGVVQKDLGSMKKKT